jgi:CHAT domain-containing protein
LGDAANASRLFIIPDGKISLVPFDALVREPGMGANWQTLPYLVRQTAVSMGFSATTLLQQSAQKIRYGNKTLGLAPVYFKREDSLQHTRLELDALEKWTDGQSFREDKAGANALKQALVADSFEVLHIATHAFADEAQNRLPFLLFGEDSLMLNELYTLNVRVRLVALSACQTAIGRLQTTEGPISLARGFYFAGAQELVTSLWNVNDKATADLFGYFYKHSSGDHNYTEALRQAKLDYLKTPDMDNKKYAPYYWAGFVKMGVSATSASESSNRLWLYLMLIPAGVGIYLLFRRKSGKISI